MAVGATGTPTVNFAIPTYATGSDAPSGQGFNSAMAFIDNLLVGLPFAAGISGISAGDVPVWNGSAWVKPTGSRDGTKFLRDDGAYAAVPAPVSATYGTALPGSPVDGAEHILVDSTTAPTYQWRFRYNASNAGSYKWEFIGGAPITSSNASGGGFTNGGYAVMSPAVTATPPRAGVYDCRYSCMVDMAAANSNGERFYLDWTGAGQSATSGNLIYVGVSSDQGFFAVREARLTLSTGSALQAAFKCWQGTGFTITHQSISITPVQVS